MTMVTFTSLLAMWLLGFAVGICHSRRHQTSKQYTTIDEHIQTAVDKMMTKAKRTDKIIVSDATRYTAIVSRDSVVFVDMDKTI